MKSLVVCFLTASSFVCLAQQTKNVTIDPAKAAEIKAMLEKAYPNAAKQIDVDAITNGKTAGVKTNSTTIKTDTTKSIAKPFTFLGSFIMNFDETNALGKSTTGKIKYAFDDYKAAMIPTFSGMGEGMTMRSTIDTKANELTILTTHGDKKSGLLMEIPKAPTAKATTPATESKPPVITKTGKSKIIQGFNCDEIVITYEDGKKIDTWVTSELTLNLAELMNFSNAAFKGKSPFGSTNISDIKGTALETNVTNKDGSSIKITLTEIKKIKPEAALFSTDGYKVSNVKGLPFFSAQ